LLWTIFQLGSVRQRGGCTVSFSVVAARSPLSAAESTATRSSSIWPDAWLQLWTTKHQQPMEAAAQSARLYRHCHGWYIGFICGVREASASACSPYVRVRHLDLARLFDRLVQGKSSRVGFMVWGVWQQQTVLVATCLLVILIYVVPSASAFSHWCVRGSWIVGALKGWLRMSGSTVRL
jgi:hypothetical protein